MLTYLIWKYNTETNTAELFKEIIVQNSEQAITQADSFVRKDEPYRYDIQLISESSVAAPESATPKNPTGDDNL